MISLTKAFLSKAEIQTNGLRHKPSLVGILDKNSQLCGDLEILSSLIPRKFFHIITL